MLYARHMLAQPYRFHGHGSLRYLYRNGRTTRNRMLLLRYIENKKRTKSRFAVIVGKKVVKSAVKRNRIRRRVFEVLRTHLASIQPKTDITITVYSAELLTMSPAELERAVISVLASAHLYTNADKSATLHH